MVGWTTAAAAPTGPAELPRTEICLNGAWDVVLDAPGDRIPSAGWSPRRAPAMPLVASPIAASAWYGHSFLAPREWARPDRRFLLKLGKVGHYAAVYCNGRLMGEHYGQYTPFETDLTGAFEPGKTNEIAIYVHNASGRYVRPGAQVDGTLGLAYRPQNDAAVRNSIGIAGDISLAWRPQTHIDDVFVVPSVRKKRLEARIRTAGIKSGTSGLRVRAEVLDGGRIVLRLPEKPLASDGVLSLEAGWSDPVLWGPVPYGQPKLYVLRTQLLKQGKVVDRTFTRFGFREVWVAGRDVLLNGKRLWMAGTYFSRLSSVWYLNDRRPQALMIRIMQSSGLNTLHGHWDDLGKTWMDLCDEMGMLVLAGFYCPNPTGPPADEGWPEWMNTTCRDWIREARNHPSIVLWRPIDLLPKNLSVNRPKIIADLAEQVRREDGTRPLADGSDIAFWSQSSFADQDSEKYDDGSLMAQRLAASSKPFLTKEIYTGFGDFPNLSRFFQTYYEKSHQGRSVGVVIQHLPLLTKNKSFRIEWLSDSGLGNRDARDVRSVDLPNWCDSSQPAWSPSPYSGLFADLGRKFSNLATQTWGGDMPGEVLVSGLSPDDFAILVPRAPDLAEAIGVRAAADGTAWAAVRQPGAYRLFYRNGSLELAIRPGRLPRSPGYEACQRVEVAR
jgi:hypothetical protein